MKFDNIKVRWHGNSARKKWTIAGIGAVLCITFVSGDHNGSRDIFRGATDTTGYATARAAPGYQTMQGYAGGYGGPAYAGGGAPTDSAASTRGSATVMSGWHHNQDVEARAARAYDQNIRDESTIRSTEDGQVYSGVSNPVADSAVESGAATQVPTAELPTTTTAPEQ